MNQTEGLKTDRFTLALLPAAFIFVLHFLEESPGFVAWFNAHVPRGITPGLFWSVNVSALVITLLLTCAEWVSRSAVSQTLAVAWLGFLMAANAAFHLAGGLVDARYVPGLVTAVLLYLPYYAWLFASALRSHRAPAAATLLAAVLGALPMLAHGYLILFRSSRLF